MKWHIENVLAALRSALKLLDALLDAIVDQKERERFASLSANLRAAEAECVALRGASPSSEGPAVPSSPPTPPEDEDDPVFRDEAPPRP